MPVLVTNDSMSSAVGLFRLAIGPTTLAVLEEVDAVTAGRGNWLPRLPVAGPGICSNRGHAHGSMEAALHHVPALLAGVAHTSSPDNIQGLSRLSALVLASIGRWLRHGPKSSITSAGMRKISGLGMIPRGFSASRLRCDSGGSIITP